MNISMGTAATAMSTILNTKVNITTPKIETIGVEEFEFTELEPVIGVLINYVEGIEGANVLLLKEADMKKILSQLFDMDTSDDIEFDEISKSAIGEIMNQMMGAAAGALASFLGKVVNISPPVLLDTTSNTSIRELFSLKGENLVSINFHLSIDGLVESEFISAMEPALAREIVQMSMGVSGIDEEEEAPPIPAETPPPPPPAQPESVVVPEVAYEAPPVQPAPPPPVQPQAMPAQPQAQTTLSAAARPAAALISPQGWGPGIPGSCSTGMQRGGASAASPGAPICATGTPCTPGRVMTPAARRTVARSPTTKQWRSASGASRKALATISGPMPAGSPWVMAMGCMGLKPKVPVALVDHAPLAMNK